jgi:hypothetical protein
MPSTPTNLGTGGTGGGGSSFSIASSSPTANAELYVVISWAQTSGSVNLGGTPVSSAFSISGSWEQLVAPTTAVGSSNVRVAAFRARASSSPGSGTVTVTYAAGVLRGRAWLVQVASDFDTTTPVRNSDTVTDGASGTTLSGTLDPSPLSASVLIAITAGADTSSTNSAAASGWTRLDQAASDMTSTLQIAVGSNGTGFGTTFDAARGGGMAALAFEVQDPVVTGPTPPFTSVTVAG